MNPLSLGTAERKETTRASRQVFRVENHDEALPIWRNAGCADRVLVHVDAHHDMWWVPPDRLVTIANFISPALRDGLLREIYWVVPDRSWESAENRSHVLRHVRRILRGFPGRSPAIEIHRDRISTTLLGKPLHVCSIEGLPRFQEDVLLDLDVDYLILPRVTYGPDDAHPGLPWIWPEDLLARLKARDARSNLVTIAYSAIGGYTPLRWKYLGDELEARLAVPDFELLRGMESMRKGAESWARADSRAAEEAYCQAAQYLPNLAAPLWQLAHLYLDSSRPDEAREMYQRATQLDPSYRGPFNSDGLWHFWNQRWDAAEHEFRRTLELEPQDAYAHIGLGWISQQHSQWTAAELEFRRALESQPGLLDAHRSLGKALEKQGLRREAILEYEKSLKLSLAGQDSIYETPGIAAERPRLTDQRHFDVYLRLGKLCLAQGERDRARSYLRMAAAGGRDGVVLRYRLASIASRQQQWSAAAAELAQASKQVVVQSGHGISKLWREIHRPFRRAFEWWRVR